MCHPPPSESSSQQQASGGEQRDRGFGYQGMKILRYGFEEVKAEFEYANIITCSIKMLTGSFSVWLFYMHGPVHRNAIFQNG